MSEGYVVELFRVNQQLHKKKFRAKSIEAAQDKADKVVLKYLRSHRLLEKSGCEPAGLWGSNDKHPLFGKTWQRAFLEENSRVGLFFYAWLTLGEGGK